MIVKNSSLFNSFVREYVVDLVGEPGNITGPDSSINGAYVSSTPSPFQISHLRKSQSPYVDDAASPQVICFNQSSSNNQPYSGMLGFIYVAV